MLVAPKHTTRAQAFDERKIKTLIKWVGKGSDIESTLDIIPAKGPFEAEVLIRFGQVGRVESVVVGDDVAAGWGKIAVVTIKEVE